MTDNIIKILEKLQIETYNIYDELRESVELFFIKTKLDLTRSKEVREIRVRVYRDFAENGEKMRGSSDVYIYPGMDDTQMEELISGAYDSALYVKNPYFELPDGEKNNVPYKERELSVEAVKTAEALFAGEEGTTDAFINSAEIFANKKTVRIITSKGSDVSYTKYNTEGEFVVQSLFGGNDVEQYQSFDYDELDAPALTEKCVKALRMVKDRAVAKKTDIDFSEYPIIITDGYVGELLTFFLNRTGAAYIYPKYSSYKKGFDIGNSLNLYGIPKKPYSDEGVAMEKMPLIEDGIVKNIHGSVQYLDYLNEKQTGTFTATECTNADMSIEEMCKGRYIMVKNFSDFQIDAFDGHFGGEFRLAYLCDGKETKIITGGTVTGNLIDKSDKLFFSAEKYSDGSYRGPAAVKIG